MPIIFIGRSDTVAKSNSSLYFAYRLSKLPQLIIEPKTENPPNTFFVVIILSKSETSASQTKPEIILDILPIEDETQLTIVEIRAISAAVPPEAPIKKVLNRSQALDVNEA